MDSERQTRQKKIDLQLGRAGWAADCRRLIGEFLVQSTSELREPTEAYRTVNEFVDYALLDRLGRPVAIVEAKRSSRDPLEGERQAADYADALLAKHGTAPFVFLANGDEIWFWHRKLYPPGRSAGSFPRKTSCDSPISTGWLQADGKPSSEANVKDYILRRASQEQKRIGRDGLAIVKSFFYEHIAGTPLLLYCSLRSFAPVRKEHDP